MLRISVFGSTGSIGCSTLDLIARRRDDFDVVALTGGRNIARLAEQARDLFGVEITGTPPMVDSRATADTHFVARRMWHDRDHWHSTRL